MMDWGLWNPRDIEKLISPIRWTLAVDKEKFIEDHIKAANEETASARKCIPCTLDVPYGNNGSNFLDIYGTDLDEGSSIFLWVHGGGWVTGHKNWSGFFVRNLHSWGFKSVVVGYPLAPEASISEMCLSVEEAVKKVISLYPKSTLIIGGHSAGAQLVSNLLCRADSEIAKIPSLAFYIKGFVLISGLYDLRTVQNSIMNDALHLSNKESEKLSPNLNTGQLHPIWKRAKVPILIVVGQHDPPEFHRQSMELHNGLLKNSILSEFWVSKGDDHFTVVENLKDNSTSACKKLKEFLLYSVKSQSSL